MSRKTLIVSIPLDDNFEKVQEYTSRLSYTKEFWHSIVPPHKIKYIFDGLNENGVDNIKESFREIFKDTRFKDYCRFQVNNEE